jgi:hypothetical protein
MGAVDETADRNTPVLSGDLVRQPHGGALRRGGGTPARSDDQTRAYRLLREGAADAAMTLLDAARAGDRRAAETVLHYALGRPVSLTDLDARALRQAIDEQLSEMGLGGIGVRR